MNRQQEVGERLRKFRKLRGISLEELSAKVYKSKSIISKYELGESVFDIDTLYKIAEVLDIDPGQLFSPRARKSETADRSGIFRNNMLYLYMVVKIRSTFRLMRCLLTFGGEDGSTVTMYMQIPDYEHYLDCKTIYTGKLVCHPMSASIYMTNQADRTDYAFFSCAVRGSALHSCVGMMMMSNYSTNDPGALKVILADAPVENEEELTEFLKINRDDLDSTKKSNIFGYRLSTMNMDLFR